MARVQWHSVGERRYELGVDRGVLYIGSAAGQPWNGLVSVVESPQGGDPKVYYIDGVKYLNISASEEFGATIDAFTYPPQFAACDGTAHIRNGLFAGQQPRVPFNFSYRTKIGNDVAGTKHGYKIHLVYNAQAAPSSKTRTTIGETVEASPFSWEVTTSPPPLTGYKPTSHFEIDSTKTPSGLLTVIEDILYGNGTTEPRMPSVQELVNLFNTYTGIEPETAPPVVPETDVLHDGGTLDSTYVQTYDGEGPSSVITNTIDGGTP